MAAYLKLADIKAHLRVDFDDDDAYIMDLMDMVEELVLTEIQGTVTGDGTVETALTIPAGTVETAGTTALVGTDTNFEDFTVGETITVSGETVRTIATITDNTHLTVSVAFDNTDTGLSYVVSTKKLLIGTDTAFTDFTAGDTIKVENETLRTIASITDDNNLNVTDSFAALASGLTYDVHPGIPSPIPAGLKHSMYLMLGHYYMNREAVIVGVGVNKMPYAFEYLVAPYKHWTIK